jgi:hypothetical protein
MGKPVSKPRGWQRDVHCPPERGEQILHPHVFTLVSSESVWMDEWNLWETGLEACRCGMTREHERRYNYGLELDILAIEGVKFHSLDGEVTP